MQWDGMCATCDRVKVLARIPNLLRLSCTSQELLVFCATSCHGSPSSKCQTIRQMVLLAKDTRASRSLFCIEAKRFCTFEVEIDRSIRSRWIQSFQQAWQPTKYSSVPCAKLRYQLATVAKDCSHYFSPLQSYQQQLASYSTTTTTLLASQQQSSSSRSTTNYRSSIFVSSVRTTQDESRVVHDP